MLNNINYNTRGSMVELLTSWEQGRAFASDLLDKLWRETDFSTRDRALITTTVNGVIRRKLTLDWLIDRFSAQKSPARDSTVRQILRLSIFHLIYLDSIPPHAILHQAGELAKRFGAARKCSYINGLLRNLLRGRGKLPFPDRSHRGEYLSVVHSHPRWLIDRWLKTRPFAKAEEICRVDNLPPRIFVRCNPLKITPKKLEAEFNRDGVDYERRDGPVAFWRIKPGGPIGSLRSFRDGHFQVQDPSSIRAVELLKPQPGERIADLCAAPGGKAIYIAQKMNNSGCLLAADNNPERLRKLTENIQRLGVSNARLERVDLLREESPIRDKEWDGILLDIPCSNTGVLGRRVDARWRIRPADIARLARQGRELLNAAANLIRPGGRIVYSTCSIEPEENQEVIRNFLRTRADYTLAKEESALPREMEGDGYYAALLKRKNNKSFIPPQHVL